MIYEKGDVLENVSRGIIAHQVNCQGVMGSGIAVQIKNKWPEVFEEYHKWCLQTANQGADLLGACQLVKISEGFYVANLFGQQFYGRDGNIYTSYSALGSALKNLSDLLPEVGMTDQDVHHPKIGAGLGGGDWFTISKLIEKNVGINTTVWMI